MPNRSVNGLDKALGRSALALVICVAFILNPAGHAALAAGSEFPERNPRLGHPYLLNISFYTKKDLTKVDQEWLRGFNGSPYDGAAVMIRPQYSIQPAEPLPVYLKKAKWIKRFTKKDVWPWVFFNRFVGGRDILPAAQRYMSKSDLAYFKQIKGMDLWDRQGALSAFKDQFRKALVLAKSMKSPGIVVDHEAYNERKNYRAGYVAEQQGKTPEEIDRRALEVGKELAHIVGEEYPSAMIWFLGLLPGRTTTQIAWGILEGAAEQGIDLRVVEGGENTIKYTNPTLESLVWRIAQQRKDFASITTRYPKRFILSGTISPTHEPNTRSGFIARGYQHSAIKNVNDLIPFFHKLFVSYSYVWINPAINAQYDPFDLRSSKPYNLALIRALTQAAGVNR